MVTRSAMVTAWYSCGTHSRTALLCFVRQNDDVDEEAGRLRLPDPTDNSDKWIQETIEAAIDESYGILEKDDEA